MSSKVQTSACPVRNSQEPIGNQVATSQPSHRVVLAIVKSIPSIVVFSLLGAVMFIGHHTGWKIAPASELFGASGRPADDWCPEHLVPESQCIECNADLFPKLEEFGFCSEHGVAECVLCHPELAQVNGEPRLPQYDTTLPLALLPRPVNNSRNILHQSRVQFVSIESVERNGIEIDVVRERAMVDEITVNGEIAFNPTRVAHLMPRVSGTVASVFKTVGDDVQSGDIVALVDSTQVGHAKSQLLQALVQFRLCRTTIERLSPVSGSGAVAERIIIDAEFALEDARVTLSSARYALANLGFELPEDVEVADPDELAADLRFAGLSAEILLLLSPSQRTANLIPVIAPIAGTIVTSEIVAGEIVDTTTLMATVVDPDEIWLILSVRQEDAQYVHAELPVRFQPDDGAPLVDGVVSWISPAVDHRTRTVQVRVNVDNADRALRDQTFGTGHIILREESHAIVVPREAIQSTPDAHFVFVRDKSYFDEMAPKFFHVRQVRLGPSDGEFVEVLAGVLPGEVVATEGSNVLLGQLLRSSLGAGCGCHQE